MGDSREGRKEGMKKEGTGVGIILWAPVQLIYFLIEMKW